MADQSPCSQSKLAEAFNGELFRDVNQNTSIALKANAMMSHPITSGRNDSTSEPLTVKRFKNVMSNIHLQFSKE